MRAILLLAAVGSQNVPRSRAEALQVLLIFDTSIYRGRAARE